MLVNKKINFIINEFVVIVFTSSRYRTMGFLQSMKGLLADSFNSFAVDMSGFNYALSYNLKNAITGVYPAYSILYEKALVCRGDLPPATTPVAVAAASGLINFTWDDNSGIGRAKAGDTAILVVYCEEANQCLYLVDGAGRGEEADSIDASVFSGKQVQTWLGFKAADGQDTATSVYTGQVTVL